MRRIALLLVCLVLIVPTFVGVRAQDAAPETIKVGAVVPLTGRYAGGGAQVERGYKLAIEAINAEGGVYVEEYDTQIPLELVLLDDESDPSKTVSHLEALNEEDVVAYLGGFGSDLHAAAAAIAEKNGVPYLGVAFALWGVHQEGYEYLFSPFSKSPDLAIGTFELLDSIDEAERPTRVGIFQESTDWGIELAEFWAEQAEEHGYEIVLHEEYAPGTQDFTDIILKAQEADVEVLLSLPNPPDGVTLFKQMGEQDWAPAFSLVIRAPDPPTWSESLATVGQYVLYAPGWNNKVNFPGVAELNEAHIALMERPADPIVGPAYSVIQILAQAITDAGSLDRDAIRDAIAASETETVNGTITFNEDGTGTVPTVLLQIQPEGIEIVYPPDQASADLVFPAPAFGDR
jgi:branched-chain amino acid transport system substrate-binding protein